MKWWSNSQYCKLCFWELLHDCVAWIWPTSDTCELVLQPRKIELHPIINLVLSHVISVGLSSGRGADPSITLISSAWIQDAHLWVTLGVCLGSLCCPWSLWNHVTWPLPLFSTVYCDLNSSVWDSSDKLSEAPKSKNTISQIVKRTIAKCAISL